MVFLYQFHEIKKQILNFQKEENIINFKKIIYQEPQIDRSSLLENIQFALNLAPQPSKELILHGFDSLPTDKYHIRPFVDNSSDNEPPQKFRDQFFSYEIEESKTSKKFSIYGLTSNGKYLFIFTKSYHVLIYPQLENGALFKPTIVQVPNYFETGFSSFSCDETYLYFHSDTLHKVQIDPLFQDKRLVKEELKNEKYYRTCSDGICNYTFDLRESRAKIMISRIPCTLR